MAASQRIICLFIILLCVSASNAKETLRKWAGFMQIHDLNNDGVIRGEPEVKGLKMFFLKEGIPEGTVDWAIENADANGDSEIDPEEYHDLRMKLISLEV